METECPRCGEPMRWHIFDDGDGDPSVPGGTRSWTDAECNEKACACDLSEDEWERLREYVVRECWDAIPAYLDY